MLKSIMRAKPQIIRKNKGMKPKRNFAFLALALATVALIRSSLLATNAISTGERLKRNTTLVKAPTLKDVVARADLVDNEPERLWERGLTPAVVWLASYPNSGTSFTMTLVERASDLSMASNYGVEVTYKRDGM